MNRAIWIDENNDLSIRAISETYKPSRGEILVEVRYSGINPADIKHGWAGMNNYPAGYEFSGTVLETGEDMESKFKTGDSVMAFGSPERGKPIQYGTHQRYHVARQFIYHVPPTISMPEAAGLLIITQTAADALFNQLELPVDFPLVMKDRFPILIWGGSSAVGCAAIQFAKKAGCYPILTTASPKNHQILLSLGASECFDYRSKTVIDQIRLALKAHSDKPLKHVIDTVGSHDAPSSISLCEACCDTSNEGVKFTTCVTNAPKGTQDWKRSFAARNMELTFQLPNGPPVVHRPNFECQANINKAAKWAIENYNQGYCMPNVKVVRGGEEAIKTMKLVAGGGASLEKFVIEHPIEVN
jgi:NADPH:quinone reductase-like Zn-dependent oxidoreductase